VDISCAAYRAVPHEATKRTPNKMMLGRELPMPSHLQVPVPQEESTDCDYVKGLENRLLESHEEARKHLKRNRQQAKKEYDKTAQETQYAVNEWVWLFNPIRKKGRSPKLKIGLEEKPHRILQVINDVLVRIKKQGGHKTRVVHVNRIRKVKDLTKLDLEDPRTPEEEQDVNPAKAAETQRRGVMRRSSVDHWRQKCLNVKTHVNSNRHSLTAKMRALGNLRRQLVEEEYERKEKVQEERLAEAREERELYRSAAERREQLDREELPLELQQRPRTIVMEQTILDELEECNRNATSKWAYKSSIRL